jgi:transcriptional regulator with XRE-family HTH domain
MQTIGDRLEEARKRKGISIREAAEATKIRGDYLQKFEGNQFDCDLAEIYVRGFLRNYANFLKLPADRILADYDALGRSEARPRAPSREVYGRMDLSISTAEEREAQAQAPQPAPAVEASSRTTPQLPRGHSNLPKAPPIDPALVFKGGIALAVLIAILVVIWLVKTLYPGSAAPSADSRAQATAAAPAAAAVSAPTLTLVALDTVRVNVTETDNNRVLLPDTTLERGQRLVVPRPGPVLIQADVGANVQFEVNGRRYAMPANTNRVRLED